ncbi:hypothetical protein D1BOALGB6SA_6020 [Olavius sp. associated proteobacterium Delta 1]|nr:hypothetical protein D1BOALGB6SA_6020 [Olavius sp. associated proteobacterium Delta 1]
MEKIWIIGLGQFGTIAFQRLSKTLKNSHFVLVDPVEKNLLKCKGPTTTLRISDGVKFLEKNLKTGLKPNWIIPALPVHLAAEWILLHLGSTRLRRVPLPSELDRQVPNPIRGSEGNLYVSHAGFKCPADCDEPRDICTITRNVRKQSMFELLENVDINPFKALNVRSHQLGPGIGGYRPEQLFELMENVEQTPGPILVSTACRCHGIITGLEKKD